jgi:hypothetical protein
MLCSTEVADMIKQVNELMRLSDEYAESGGHLEREYLKTAIETALKTCHNTALEEAAKVCDEVQRQYGQFTFTARVSAEQIRSLKT